jgi:hypothetical protein
MGFIISLGAPVAWKSRAQRSVSPSSTEAEHRAISEVCAEIMCIKQVLEFLEQVVKLPTIVRVDNAGATCLANSAATSGHAKHVDVSCHHVREHIEDGVVKIGFVKSKGDRADVHIKNTSQGIHEEHVEKHLESSSNSNAGEVKN